MAKQKPIREKIVCEACGNNFPAGQPVCLGCRWPVEDRPDFNNQILYTLRRIARALDSLRFYAWEDRGGRS